MSIAPVRPCFSCPYRKDVASGVWAIDEYLKLPEYDNETGDQPTAMFFCHQQDGRVCSGWAGCHDMDHSLSLRLASALGRVEEEDLDAILNFESPVPLFATGAEAAIHGLQDIEKPGPEAQRSIARLQSKLRRKDGR